MHLSDTIGGYDFFDKEHLVEIDNSKMPRYVEQEKITKEIFEDENSKVLEINSKSGLYPLYLTYTFYQLRLNKIKKKEITVDEKIAIWDDVVSKNIFVICKSPMAKLITQRTLLGYRKGKFNMHSFDNLVMQLKEKQNIFIQKILKPSFWGLGGNKQMKFNAIVGNPPYQQMDGGAQASASPLYNYFVEASKQINPDYISLIMPSRWMVGGKGLDAFRSSMIHDKRISKLFDYLDGKDVFNNVDIKGGVCYFLYDKKSNEPCDIYTIGNNVKTYSKRYLANDNEDIFVRLSILISIKNKVLIKDDIMLDRIVSSRNPYGLAGDTMYRASKYNLPEFSNKPYKDGYDVIGLDETSKRSWKYLKKDYPIPKFSECLNEYKVFVARAYGCGAIGEVPSTPVLGTPRQLCTETFIEMGPFKSKIESKNLMKYIETRFFRCLVGVQKQTQDATKKVYRFVPMQDFTNNSDIDWSKSINEIDKQLYKKYKLSEEEINFIEENVKEM